MSNTYSKQCLNCEKTEEDAPLVAMQYVGKEAWICPACLPILIHDTNKLDEKFAALIAS